jgi:hypothetical protein
MEMQSYVADSALRFSAEVDMGFEECRKLKTEISDKTYSLLPLHGIDALRAGRKQCSTDVTVS